MEEKQATAISAAAKRAKLLSREDVPGKPISRRDRIRALRQSKNVISALGPSAPAIAMPIRNQLKLGLEQHVGHLGPPDTPLSRIHASMGPVLSMGHLIENAAAIADSINVDTPLLDLLYQNSRCKPLLARDAWEKQVRIAFAAEQIMRIQFRERLIDYKKVVNEDAVKHTCEMLDSVPGGCLVLAFHGGFTKLTQMVFMSEFMAPTLAAGRRRGGMVRAMAEPKSALFEALRMLQGGAAVFIAPDGPNGKQTATLNVLGKKVLAGEGAAFLAFTAACKTAWYNFARNRYGFHPVLKFGPQRRNGETFGEFRDRFYRFYSEQIENVATGEPRNIRLSRRWVNWLIE